MSASDGNTDAIKDRHWYNSIHDARITALESIRNAATVRQVAGRSDNVAHMKQAHSATVAFFLELEPSIQTSEYAEQYMDHAELGHITFDKLGETWPIVGFRTYAKLDNPVELEGTQRKSGLLGASERTVTDSQLIPLSVITRAYRHLRLFAHEHNLTRSETEEEIHGEPF